MNFSSIRVGPWTRMKRMFDQLLSFETIYAEKLMRVKFYSQYIAYTRYFVQHKKNETVFRFWKMLEYFLCWIASIFQLFSFYHSRLNIYTTAIYNNILNCCLMRLIALLKPSRSIYYFIIQLKSKNKLLCNSCQIHMCLKTT